MQTKNPYLLHPIRPREYSLWTSLVCWIGIAMLLGLIWKSGQAHPWLSERISTTPVLYLYGWGFLIVLAIGFSRVTDEIWRIYQAGCDGLFARLTRFPLRTGLGIITASSLFFWYFRIQRVDSGDILEWVMAAKQGKAFLVEHAPLETLIRCWLSEILRVWPGIDLSFIYQILLCFYGGMYAWVILRFSAKFPNPYSYLTPLFLFITAAMNVFFGYQEIYGAANLAQVIFLLSVMRYFFQSGSFIKVSFWYGIALAVGFWHGIYFPAYIYLFWIYRQKNRLTIVDWLLNGLWVVAPVLIALVALIPYANPFAGIITRLSEPSIVIPFSPFAQAMGYTLWGKMHLADVCNEILLLIPVALMLLIARFVFDFRGFRAVFRTQAFRFFFIACLCCGLFGFLYFPVLGFPLDWDLYTFIYPSFGFCGVWLMSDVQQSKFWRKRLVVLALLAVALASCWILQNDLFWRYPVLLTNAGPFVSPFVPDFYYKNMQRAFERSNQANLYWLADRALEESPGKYGEILRFMDDWTISTLAKIPPQPFDYPGWACDLAALPGVDRTLIFDKLGRLFLYDGHTLKWIYAPAEKMKSPVVAGDVQADGSAILLCEDGSIFRVSKEVLERGIAGEVVWEAPQSVSQFQPESPSERGLLVKMADLAIRPSDGAICVADNFNRVWDTASHTLLLQGEPSYNLVQALHFNYNQRPVTIDVNDRLSYDRAQMKLTFPVAWFHPIVRDFLFTPDEKGLMVLDLNGNIHYMGAAPIYKDIVLPGNIIDRYKKMIYRPDQDELLILDNRYRLMEAGLDADGTTARQKISNMIAAGDYATAFHSLSVLWQRSSIYTPICYELINAEVVRNLPGAIMYVPEDAIRIYVDLLPVDDDLSVLIDRWGRLVALNKGVLFLLQGTGLSNWPRSEAIDGAMADGQVFFLCQNGTVWNYPFRRFWGEQSSPFDRTPARWGDLHDYDETARWIGIEATKDGRELLALSESGLLLRFDLNGDSPRLMGKVQIPLRGKPIFDFDYREMEDGYDVAYTSTDGPAFLYTSRDQTLHEIPQSDFGWPVVSDIRFSWGENMVLLDRYGVIHQYDSILKFSDKPYSVIMDAMAIRFLSPNNHVQWMRSNGEIRTLRVEKM